MLAEKVETDEEVTWAMEAGFDYFQGYAIERPEVVRASALPTSVTSHLQLAATMLAEDVDFDELERILRREPGLVVQVLQLASLGAGGGLSASRSPSARGDGGAGSARYSRWAGRGRERRGRTPP